jgi:anti-sigma B factor antagonist
MVRRIAMPLTVQSRIVGDFAILCCSGRIVVGAEVDTLRQNIKDLDSDLTQVVLDLSEVTFMDSSGLGTLVRLTSSLRARGGDLRLCSVPEVVSKVLKLTNLNRLFEMHPTEVDAVAAFYEKPNPNAVPRSGVRLLCLDSSPDLLAFLREVLERSGYHALIANNVYDALILLRAAPPKVLILGPTLDLKRAGHTAESFRKAAESVPVLELGADFSLQDAGAAATHLIGRLESLLESQNAQHA